jgi:hypothetical protein
MTIEFVLAEYRVKEDGTWLTERPSIIRTGGTGACSVKVSNASSSTTAGRGTRDKDYSADSSTTVSFAVGETGIKYIDFQIIQDTLDEPDEYIPLSLSLVSGTETLGAIKSSKVTIIDDEEPEPELFRQVSGVSLRHVNLAGYGLNYRQPICINVNTALPNNQELPISSNVADFLQEIPLPQNESIFPVRNIRIATDWATPANIWHYLFIGNSVENFVCPSPTDPNNIVVVPVLTLNSRANYSFWINEGQRVWVATHTPNTSMRLFVNVENYSTNWIVESGFNVDSSDKSLKLFPLTVTG